jgi:superfamily II DNA or RNA helicase
LTVIILVQHKEHGKLLLEMLKASGVRADYIFGEHKQEERQSALNKLKNGKIDVLIGSTILDVGVDVPAVGVGILAGGGKAEVALRQRVGRVLRAKKLVANVAFVVDFDDEHNDHTRKHAAQRRAIVEATPGFAENILAPGEDFDFESFGFKKAA